MAEPARGHVYIVGAGPGDPALATVAAVRAIAAADVVLYDALAAPALLAGAKPDAELVYVGKRAGDHELSQGQIEAEIVRFAQEGKVVVRLKGGDPFVFGRGSEEALACRRAGVPFTVVPGVTSALGAPAYAGIPVTHRGVSASFMVITGSESADAETGVDWDAAARAGTLVILMGVAGLARAMERLESSGMDGSTPVACVRWGTRADQRVLRGTVGDIAGLAREARLEAPVVTVVGPVVDLAESLAWFDPGPLAGKHVVVTRARDQASELVQRLTGLGALVIEAPVISQRLLTPNPELRKELLRRPAWLLFTSANGVRALSAQLDAAGLDGRALAGTRIAAVGTATYSALRGVGLRADFMPPVATGVSLAESLPVAPGESVLYPASSLADGQLAEVLATRGAEVRQVGAYETVAQPLDAERHREIACADAVTFTSGSTARNLLAAAGTEGVSASAVLVSIGPQTSAAVLQAFGRVDVEASEPSLDALISAVVGALT